MREVWVVTEQLFGIVLKVDKIKDRIKSNRIEPERIIDRGVEPHPENRSASELQHQLVYNGGGKLLKTMEKPRKNPQKQ